MFHFRCDHCSFARDLAYLPRNYVFEDGRQMKMLQRHIWCSHCTDISVAEAFAEDPVSIETRQQAREQSQRNLARGGYVHGDLDLSLDDVEDDILPGDSRLVPDPILESLDKKWIRQDEEYECNFAEWKVLRTRPQFCLKCGNEEIHVPQSSWSDLPHPTCGGTLKCTATIYSTTARSPEPHLYSLDGILIELGVRQGLYQGDKAEELELWWPPNIYMALICQESAP